MKILLTNDDGYNSVGFEYIYNKLSKKFDVYVCVPMQEKSGASSSLTLYNEMEYKKIFNNGYAINATPVDCTKIGIHGFFREVDFDFIISGINHGLNLCGDIIYSGTFGAASEGVINGITSIACSINNLLNKDFDIFSDFICDFVSMFKYVDMNKYKNLLFNINCPSSRFNFIDLFTLPGIKQYDDKILILDDIQKVRILVGTKSYSKIKNTDIMSINSNNISISVFKYNGSTFRPLNKNKKYNELLKIIKNYHINN